MKRPAVLLLAVLFSVALTAQEQIALTTPETKPTNSQYHTERLTVDFDAGLLTIQLLGQNNEALTCVYNSTTTPTGTFLMTALNKANLSSAYAGNATTGSLKFRIYHRLIVMGESTAVCGKTLTGTVSGSVP